MIVLVAKLRQDDFVLEASVKTYIMAIAKNLWFKKLRSADRETMFQEIHNDTFSEEINLAIAQEKTSAINFSFLSTRFQITAGD